MLAWIHGQGVEHLRHARRRVALQVNRASRPPQLGPPGVALRRSVDDERRLARGNPPRGLYDRQLQRGHLARQPRRQVQDLRPDAGIGQPRLDADADLQPVRIPVAVRIRGDARRAEEILENQGMYRPPGSHATPSFPERVDAPGMEPLRGQ